MALPKGCSATLKRQLRLAPCGHVFQGSPGETSIFHGRFPMVAIGVRDTLHRPFRVATEWHCLSIERRLYLPQANAGRVVDCMRIRD